MNRGIQALLLIGALLLSALAGVAAEPPAPTLDQQVADDAWAWHLPDQDATVRTVRVKAVAGPRFRASADWRERIARRVELTSKQLEADFAIRLELGEVEPWDGVDEQGELAAAFHALWTRPETTDADIIVAFLHTGHMSCTTKERADAESLGRASPFGRHIALRDTPELSAKMKIHTFVHELGHLFGALHSDDERCLMHRYVTNEGGAHFDLLNGERIWRAREFDFRSGVAGLADETVQGLGQLYAAGHRPDEENPVVMAWHNLGVELTVARDFDGALQAYDAALALDADKAAAHLNRGLILRELGRLAEAEAALRRALDCDSRVPGASVNLADTLMRLGRLDDAIVEMERQLIRLPKDAAAWHMLGVARAASGQIDEAIDAYVQAVVLDGSIALRPMLMPGDAATRARLSDEAQARVKTEPESGEARVRLGLLLRLRDQRLAGLTEAARGLELLGDYHGAALLCTSALSEAPNDRGLLHLSARLTLAAGRHDDAIHLFGDLVARDKTDAAAYRGLGDAYRAKGMLSTALKYYQQAQQHEDTSVAP
jgi:tetratricopeptide (TPR) repeat protein